MTDLTLRTRIAGTGSAVPKRRLTNKDLEQIVDTTDEWIVRRSGIKERRIASPDLPEKTVDLATLAAERAMEMAGVAAEELDLIIVGTVTPDMQFPSTACQVQARLGAGEIAAYDLSAGCSGFIYAISQADNAIRAGSAKTVLVVGVERLSTILNWKDRGTCVLLGDGAGAVVLKGGRTEEGILATSLKSNGNFADLLYSEWGNDYLPPILADIEQKPFHLIMEGNRLFKRAIRCLAGIATQTLDSVGLTGQDVALVIPHQANIRIIEAMAQRLDISMDRVFTNIQRYGNTSTASIPLALDEANRAGRIKKGDVILMEAFGAGLTWGAAVVKWGI